MKSKSVWWILFGLLIIFTGVACKSTPPQAEVTPPQGAVQDNDNAPPDQAALNDLNEASSRALAARKFVMDFDGPALLPSDWQSADSLYTQAEQQKRNFTRWETRESIDRYNKAADAFEAMKDNTLAQYYANKEKELTDARNAAVSAGVGDLAPDYLLDADNTVADAVAKYQGKDYYAAKDTAAEALTKYTLLAYGADVYNVRVDAVDAGAEELVPDLLGKADNAGLDAIDKYTAKDYTGAKNSAANAESMYGNLKAGLAAYKVREEIANRDFEVYDPQNIDLADDTLRSAADDYNAGNFAAAKDKADAALVRYNLALKTAWESYSAEKGADASTERQKALDLKANVAVREEFNSAQAVYVRANAAFQAKNHEDAAKLYLECQSMFSEVARVALQKRQAADAALDRANQKLTESDETARNAEVILEGGI